MDNTGPTTYQSGTTLPNNFHKSSHFVFVKDESLYGEINLIMEHYQDARFIVSPVHHNSNTSKNTANMTYRHTN